MSTSHYGDMVDQSCIQKNKIKKIKRSSAVGLKCNYIKCNKNVDRREDELKSCTIPGGLTEASAIQHNAVQANGFASSLHLQELFLTMGSL